MATLKGYAEQELHIQPNDPLFPKTLIESSKTTLKFYNAGLSREHWANATPVRELFKHAFTAADLPYYHPHSFRRMLIIWAMEHCSQIEFKAISQNIGHEHAATSYNSYGTLNEHKRRNVIGSIGRKSVELGHISNDILAAEMRRRLEVV